MVQSAHEAFHGRHLTVADADDGDTVILIMIMLIMIMMILMMLSMIVVVMMKRRNMMMIINSHDDSDACHKCDYQWPWPKTAKVWRQQRDVLMLTAVDSPGWLPLTAAAFGHGPPDYFQRWLLQKCNLIDTWLHPVI